jgi:hypothetical protein
MHVDELIQRAWPADWPQLRDDHVGFLRHEPIERTPNRLHFRITGPRGFSGWHGWDLEDGVVRHTVEADCQGWVRVAWPLVIRPIHNALHEDVLAEATGRPRRGWSLWVRFLRRVLR